jgi:RimJ/RimL family protein N-acetyltransferase
MKFPNQYQCIKIDFPAYESLSIRPIRYENKDKIRIWRNDQINILRQARPLSKSDQDTYFKNVIESLFDQRNPDQIIVGLYDVEELIGYGGLVHIDWGNKHAEISFLLSSEINSKKNYLSCFKKFLVLIEQLASKMNLNKIYTIGYATDHFRFEPLVSNDFRHEATLKKHKFVGDRLVDSLIYGKIL